MAISGTRDGHGCLLLADDGSVHAHGTVRHLGDISGFDYAKAPVDIAACPTASGYWIIDAAGNVYAFGSAPFLGGVPQVTDTADDPVCIRPNPRGSGYWIVDRSGGICGFGETWFNGPLAEIIDVRDVEVIDFAPDPRGKGYWLLDAIGGVFAVGDVEYLGAPTDLGAADAIGLLASSTGYLVFDRRGAVFSYGDAVHRGSLVGLGQRVLAAG